MINKFTKILSSAMLILACSCVDQANQKTQIRFVDLDGKPREIKTRIPEANAKIMAGQAVADNSRSNNMPAQKATSDDSAKNIYINKNRRDQQPLYSDADSYSPDKAQKDITKVKSDSQNPTFEYNLAEEENADKKDLALNVDSDKALKNKGGDAKNNSANDDDLEDKNLKDKDNNIITYSTKKFNKTPIDKTKSKGGNKNIAAKKDLVAVEDSAENDSENLDELSPSPKKQRLIAIKDDTENGNFSQSEQLSKGKYYVQLGYFSSSAGAKKKLNSAKKFGNAKIFTTGTEDQQFNRVVVGPFKNKALAAKTLSKVKKSGQDAILIKGE